ncbi:MAG: serine/threonine protein phosphatase, partial [Cyanobacteria bacterium P01_A01_bin.70]
DNVSVVLMQIKPTLNAAYDTMPDQPAPAEPPTTEDLTEASKALLYGEETAAEAAVASSTEGAPKATVPRWWLAIMAIAILCIAGGVGWWVAGRLTPTLPTDEIESVE